jgi:hypothetical protein
MKSFQTINHENMELVPEVPGTDKSPLFCNQQSSEW